MTAFDGLSGLAIAQTQLPDLIISDVMMPGISGFELLRQLKQDDLTNHIPVVLLTAKGDIKDRLKGWAEKADEYLEKPFNSPELLLRIDNLLSIRSLLKHRHQQMLLPVSQLQVRSTTKSLPQMDSLNGVNQSFVQRINEVLEQHYSDDTLDVAFVAGQLSMSSRQFNRKVKSVLDLTPTEFIRTYRLNKAAELLRSGKTSGAVAHEVGFSSHSYFSSCFKAHFDCMPSSY